MNKANKFEAVSLQLDEETLKTLKTGIKTAIAQLRRLERDCVKQRDYQEAASLVQRIAKQEGALDVIQDALDEIAMRRDVEENGINDPDFE